MSNHLHASSHAELKRLIQNVKEECLQICNATEHDFNSVHQILSPEEVREKTHCYIRALCDEVQQTDTPIRRDVEVVVDQFLCEIKEKNKQLDELTIFTQAAVNDVQAKIDRLNNQIKVADEAKSKPKQNSKEEFRNKANQRFKLLKSHLHNLFTSMFPEDYSEIMVFLGNLMQESQNEQSNGYVPVTAENFRLIEMLMTLNLLKLNPYNKNEVKLDYN